ncbi:hypothetical protein [Oscillatoria salina]|uniref:hypothetical protein n=1 Tax=Oscillatoria salina TaxID=331517 RepID=UPI0013BBFB9C|nr:hypothetical protein [Oscillatoria salina]MBZ8181212.1 hypothetical protein [Oscillatoria salina IIICB1]NET90772.1 hypothetical protein [Kamptonema sp. SIO1D9]
MRQISAFIDRNGNKQWGTPDICSSRKISEGTYLIEFQQPFSQNPVATATIYGSPWQTFNISVAIIEVSPYHCIYLTSTPDRPVDCGTMVMIMGEE